MKISAALVAGLSALVLAIPAAASISTLYSFAGPDGETPAAPLVQGSDGFLYGVAAHGGDFNVLPPDGGGTVFRTDGFGNLTTLHVFDGEHPVDLVCQVAEARAQPATRTFWPASPFGIRLVVDVVRMDQLLGQMFLTSGEEADDPVDR